MLNIGIGTEPRQLVPCEILKHGIRKHASCDVNIVESWTPKGGWHELINRYPKVSGTPFSGWRWMLPELFNYEGVAVYLDADQACHGDIADLVPYLDSKTIACVVGAEGTFGGKSLSTNTVETSVMAMNLPMCRWNAGELFNKTRADKLHDGGHPPDTLDARNHTRPYTRMMQAKWVDFHEIGQLPKEWNHYNLYVPGETRITHWSKVAEQPWTDAGYDRNPARQHWVDCLLEVIEAGGLSKGLVREEMKKRHITKKLEKHL